MTISAVEVITSVQRRRRWTRAERERLVAASLEPGASVSAIAREAGLHPGQLYGWRRQLCGRPAAAAAFAAVRIAQDPASALPQAGGMIEIELATGTRLRITGAVDPGTLSAALGIVVQGAQRR